MRIFAIPILKNKTTYYCHHKPKVTTFLTKMTNYAARKWEELSYADKQSLKGRIYVGGQNLLDKIDYQEYFLKGVPMREERGDDKSSVPLLYPSNVFTSEQIVNNLQQLLERRSPYHRKYMIYSALFVPLSATFSIVPVLPNIPLFYNLFRLYSHYKAYKGAQHLSHIIEDNRLVPTASKELINIYNGFDLNKNEVIDEQRIHNIAKKFGLTVLENDVKRARNQILEKIRKENQEKNSNSTTKVDDDDDEDNQDNLNY
ncbi:mitochondrial K+-H+ exchange-related-domain-containing protein [Rhizophagus clarus]|uniref:Mitochondrial K+-H+ exchange-related-domain-containing protein n=1 Tax=Rhizophagus clarus TaxID=94130 RepID=A0A8H3LQS8_9GLOM|nr:mitochondrial K+-H+ exchange-related-domain-containing protein [Rhizophagus clarus]